MTLFSGKLPRNHAGKKCEVSIDLPERGGRHRINRGHLPAATSRSLRLSKERWRAGSHRLWLAYQASAPGLVRANCDSLKQFTGESGGAGVGEDQPGEVAVIG